MLVNIVVVFLKSKGQAHRWLLLAFVLSSFITITHRYIYLGNHVRGNILTYQFLSVCSKIRDNFTAEDRRSSCNENVDFLRTSLSSSFTNVNINLSYHYLSTRKFHLIWKISCEVVISWVLKQSLKKWSIYFMSYKAVF